MNKDEETIEIDCGCLTYILGLWLWPYSINSWLQLGGHESVVYWYHSLIIGIFFNSLLLPFTIFTWICMKLLGA